MRVKKTLDLINDMQARNYYVYFSVFGVVALKSNVVVADYNNNHIYVCDNDFPIEIFVKICEYYDANMNGKKTNK